MAARNTTSTFKEWLHPGLMYVITIAIGYIVSTTQSDLSMMKNDIKTLLAQSNVDKTEISQLKQEVADLQHAVFMTKPASSTSIVSQDTTIHFYAAVDGFFKHEEEFDIKRHIPRRI